MLGWWWWWARVGQGREQRGRTSTTTAGLCLGGAAPANGNAAQAEPPRFPASCWREGNTALRLAAPHDKRRQRLRVLGVRLSLER